MDPMRIPLVGQRAPDFELPDDMGRLVRLSDVVSKGKTILIFYPADFGPICSIQMGEIRDLYEDFVSSGIQIVPVSTNSVRSHSAWKESMRLPFHLLADESGRVADLYGMACDDDAWLKNRSCRGVFILDENMNVRYRWIPPNPHVRPDVPALLKEARSII